MKKLLLAPAVALAFTGLAAAPVVAAEPTESQSAEATAGSASDTTDKAGAAGSSTAGTATEEPVEEEDSGSAAETPKETEKPTPKKKSKPAPAGSPSPEPPTENTDSEPGSGEDNTDSGKGDEEKDEEVDDKVGPQDIEATLDVSPEEITAEDLADPNKGVSVAVNGVLAGDTVTDDLTNKPTEVDADGSVTLKVYYDGDPTELEAGPLPFTVTIEREGEDSVTLEGVITIAEDEDDQTLDASLTVVPEEITAADLANKDKGFEITVDGLRPGDTVEDSLTGDGPETVDGTSYSSKIYFDGDASQIEPGPIDFTVAVVRGEGEDRQEQVLDGTITVVEPKDDDPKDDGDDKPEAPVDASLTVTPKTIEAADFVNAKKGVTLTVKDCEPGAEVHFSITPKGMDVAAYENTETADDKGTASVSVFGTTSDEAAYVGDYTVTASCGDDTMKDSFSVTAGASTGGSNDSSGDLPRTGADLGSLSAGAVLLLVGGAAVALTGRRKTTGQSPTDI